MGARRADVPPARRRAASGESRQPADVGGGGLLPDLRGFSGQGKLKVIFPADASDWALGSPHRPASVLAASCRPARDQKLVITDLLKKLHPRNTAVEHIKRHSAGRDSGCAWHDRGPLETAQLINIGPAPFSSPTRNSLFHKNLCTKMPPVLTTLSATSGRIIPPSPVPLRRCGPENPNGNCIHLLTNVE